MEVGHVSEPFRSALGWELAKVIDRKEVPYEISHGHTAGDDDGQVQPPKRGTQTARNIVLI